MGFFSKTEISSFESIFMRISGMRSICEYEIANTGDKAELSLYQMYYGNGEEERRLIAQGSCSAGHMKELLNSCEVTGWNGFNGKHPKNVRDGEMFRFRALVNEGLEICAEGSENFPKHFNEFRREIDRMLREQ